MKLEEGAIYIYGAGGNGIQLAALIGPHVQEIIFIDERANEIKGKINFPVYKLEEINIVDNATSVVIVSIKNVFEHHKIASALRQKGFNYIIYKPKTSLRKNTSEDKNKELNVIYEALVEKKIYKNYELPAKTVDDPILEDPLFIRKQDDYVVTWCPVELLHNYKKATDYSGLNMGLFFPLIELYKFFGGKIIDNTDEVLENFFVYCGEWLKRNNGLLTDSQKNSFIRSRFGVFKELEKMGEGNILFFIDNAPTVEYEDGKFFMSSSGRNRVCYLISRGFKLVPVKMSQRFHIEWCNNLNRDVYGKTNHFAMQPNPYAYSAMIDFPDYMKLFIMPVVYSILKKIYMNSTKYENEVKCVDFAEANNKIKHINFFLSTYDEDVAKNYIVRQNMNVVDDIKKADFCILNMLKGEQGRFNLDNFAGTKIYVLSTSANRLIKRGYWDKTMFVTFIENQVVYGYEYTRY